MKKESSQSSIPYDAVIVGAGPAGLMAARELQGLNYIVIDSKKEIGMPLKCGEGVPEKEVLELFGRTDFNFVKNRTSIVEVICGKTKRALNFQHLILDRPEFEKWLAMPVKEKIKLETRCIDIDKKDGLMEVKTNKGNINAKLVILAHGCDYRIQKKFKLLYKGKEPLLIPCYGGIFRHELDKNKIYFFFDDEDATGFWVFPKEDDKANAGIGVLPNMQKEKIDVLFKKILAKHHIKLQGEPGYGGIFPSSGPIKKTYADRLLVCGNAAGQVYAGSGEGIYYSLKAGSITGKVAREAVAAGRFGKSFLKQYEKLWKASIGRELKAGKTFAALLYLGFKFRKLERLFAIPNDDELTDMLMKGRVPARAKIAFNLAAVMGLFRSKKEKIPLALKIIAKALSGSMHN